MSLQLVPTEVQESYLKGYSKEFRAEIRETYEQIKAEKLARTVKGTPSIKAVFGSPGTGVTTLVQKISTGSVVCNAERFISRTPTFMREAAATQELYGNGHLSDVRQALAETTARLLPAGKAMENWLMQDALEEGRDVMIVKRGRTDGGVKLLENINRAGISLHTILYQAPLSLKLAGAGLYEKSHDIAYTNEEVTAEHESLTRNMMALAGKSQDQLTVYFRLASDAQATPVAKGIKGQFSVEAPAKENMFNGYFLDQAITIQKLMAPRKSLPAGLTERPSTLELV